MAKKKWKWFLPNMSLKSRPLVINNLVSSHAMASAGMRGPPNTSAGQVTGGVGRCLLGPSSLGPSERAVPAKGGGRTRSPGQQGRCFQTRVPEVPHRTSRPLLGT